MSESGLASRRIDPVRLKVAAERLERVLKQYPGSDDVLGLLLALESLINAAKAMDLSSPMDRADIPGAYNFADGVYRSYDDPDVEEAFVAFSIELRGGLTDQEKLLHERIMKIAEPGCRTHATA